jgi:RHS repeat-associated protein
LVRHQPLQAPALLFQTSQAPRFIHFHAPKLALPPVVGLHPNVVLRAGRHHRGSPSHLLQYRYLLFITESTFLHFRSAFLKAELHSCHVHSSGVRPNRLSLNDNGAITTYTADNLNEYTSVGSDSPSYDGNGNLATQEDWAYVYDAQNRLVSVQNGDGTYFYAYDPRNRCVSRTFVPPPPQHGHGGAVVNMITFYLYDAWNLIADIGQGDNFIYQYVHGSKPDELVARLNPSSTVYYHADAQNSTVALTDGNGNTVERYAYDVFGDPTVKDGNGYVIDASAFANRFLFTGRELLDTGLYDYRNRIYSPDTGRFLQTDPVRFGGRDTNLYRYVRNDATNSTDPTGLQGELPENVQSTCLQKCAQLCGNNASCICSCQESCENGEAPNPLNTLKPPLMTPIPGEAPSLWSQAFDWIWDKITGK